MNRKGCGVLGAVLGLLLSGNMAWADYNPMLAGKGHLGVSLESELSSRDMKIDGLKERERVARQSVELAYGVIGNLDLFVKFGLGKIEFEEADTSSQIRPLTGIGLRSTMLFGGGYFAGFSAQYLSGKVSKFEQNSVTLTMEDKWTETDIRLLAGSKDMIKDPEPDLRFYTGLRFSGRTDKLPSSTAKQDSSMGGVIGVDYSESKIFRFNVELGTLDRSNILVRFGIVF